MIVGCRTTMLRTANTLVDIQAQDGPQGLQRQQCSPVAESPGVHSWTGWLGVQLLWGSVSPSVNLVIPIFGNLTGISLNPRMFGTWKTPPHGRC